VSEACEKSGKLVCHEVTSNIAIDSLPTLQMSLGIVALFEMIYDGEPILTVFSNIWDAVSVQYRCINEGYDVKSVSQIADRHHANIGKQFLFANDRNRVRGAVLGLSRDGACTNLFENFREYSLKGDLLNDTTVNSTLFSLVNTFQ
jgi:hypothetical protein